jgi:ribosome-binding factor A
MANIIFNSITTGRTAIVNINDHEEISGSRLHQLVAEKEVSNLLLMVPVFVLILFSVCQAVPFDFLSISWNGKSISSSTDIIHFDRPDVFLQIHIPCPGGKGGFGSMLRAIGAQIEKTTNKDACRDLSGRRLRDVNAEKKIKDYIAKQAKRREQENKKRKEKLARLRRQPKIEFKDDDYFKTRSELPDIVDDAVSQGMRKVLAASQRKTVPTATVTLATVTSAEMIPEPAAEPVPAAPVPVIEASTSSTSSTASSSNSLKRKAVPAAVNNKKVKSCEWLGIDEDVSSDEE